MTVSALYQFFPEPDLPDPPAHLSGLAYLQALMTRDLQPPTALGLLGIRITDAAEGRVSLRLSYDASSRYAMGSVHGGPLITLLSVTAGYAALSAFPAGMTFTVEHFRADVKRSIGLDAVTLIATGKARRHDRHRLTAEVAVCDGSGHLFATARSHCFTQDVPAPA